jgi:hypothetical protein
MAASGVFGKLNLKEQTEIVVLNAPERYEAELRRLRGVKVRRDLAAARAVPFALAFVTRQAEVDRLAKSLAKKAEGDAVVWFAYPKGTSKRYTCEFNRDTGWRALGAAGFEPVRLVAIDEDWSALRFRRAAFIKTMKRSPAHALSQAGKERAVRPAAAATFLASVPADRRADVARVREVILRRLPAGYEEAVVRRMLVYQVPLARYPDTYNGHALWYVALASQKSYLSLYLMGAYGDRGLAQRVRDGFKAAGKKLDMGKSCIHFKRAGDLPLDVIGDIVAALPLERWVAIAQAARRR